MLLRRAEVEAIGGSSSAVAGALGRQDVSRAVSRAEAIANGTLLGRLGGDAVNGIRRTAYGATPDDCVATVATGIDGRLAGWGSKTPR